MNFGVWERVNKQVEGIDPRPGSTFLSYSPGLSIFEAFECNTTSDRLNNTV